MAQERFCGTQSPPEICKINQASFLQTFSEPLIC